MLHLRVPSRRSAILNGDREAGNAQYGSGSFPEPLVGACSAAVVAYVVIQKVGPSKFAVPHKGLTAFTPLLDVRRSEVQWFNAITRDMIMLSS